VDANREAAGYAAPLSNSEVVGDIQVDTSDDIPASYTYALRDDFLSPGEASFFRVLLRTVSDDLMVFPKVRLADLIYPPKQDSQYGAWQRINRKHVDFVLCATETLRPRLVIELDDRSHRQRDRIARDVFVDEIFAEVGLPILRVPARYAYASAQLATMIQEALSAAEQRMEAVQRGKPHSDVNGNSPTCERCGGEMQLRTATQGKHAGGAFWGCTNYPRCRFILPLATSRRGVASN
jgi:very-short-patch-repair endonuclease